MRTTVDLPDELFRRAKARAALQGMKLKDLFAGYIHDGLARGGATEGLPARRSEFPIFRLATGTPIPALTNAEIEELLVLEDLEHAAGR